MTFTLSFIGHTIVADQFVTEVFDRKSGKINYSSFIYGQVGFTLLSVTKLAESI